jgi:DNA polymerase I-like protein with 3'-5' exonuclease and polymerase domains
MLAHYMAIYDDGEYGEQVVNGDIHTINQKAAGLPTRDQAKTFIYGFLYGAGVAKLGQIVNGSVKQGKILKNRFLAKLPALEKLSDAVKDKAHHKFLLGLNKRKYYIRSDHSALNVLLQGAGAMIMKYYLVQVDKDLQKLGYTPGKEYEFIGNIHDEIQIEVDKNLAEDIAKVCVDAFPKVEQELNFRVKLEGEAKIGSTWEETH